MKTNRMLMYGLIGVLLIMTLTLIGCRAADQAPTATASATVSAAATATPPPTVVSESGSTWERIQRNGKIVVGTSADYPPFEFYTPDLKIDGYDIALMDEIGRRLGIPVEYRDLAFDGLIGALQVRQIDVAIAAIGVTPEREARVDFSRFYFVGEDAILARGDSGVSIGLARDLAAYRLGVQRDSLYETWIQDTLIDTNLMPARNLHTYERLDDALLDLDAQRIDLVILDAQAAEVAANDSGFKIVGRGLNLQQLAIAMPQGSDDLKAELDRVIGALATEGFTSELARTYMGLGENHVQPTPEPLPPEPACVDAMAFVEHTTRQGEILPGQAYMKGWRVQNTGTCAWSPTYRLEFASGDALGGRPVAVGRSVAPGETYDFEVPLVAALQPGRYTGVWQMRNDDGQAFGERLVVQMTVGAWPTATPKPTQTPAPGIAFSVDRDRIRQGECVTFNWNVQNIQAVYFYPESERWQDHGVVGQASQRECPSVNTTFYLRVLKRDGTVEIRQATIYVEPAAQAPNITRFTVDPPNQITLGQCVTLRWNVEGNVSRITLTANGVPVWDGAPTGGSYQHCPSAAGTMAYAIDASGSGGTSRGQQNINIVLPATATPVPTPAPQQPAIYSFSVTPNLIAQGECVNISYSAGGGANYVRVLRNGAAIVDNGPLQGQGRDCPTPAGTYNYRMEAFNAVGQSVAQERAVQVTAAVQANPLSDTFWEVTQVGPEAVVPGTRLTMAFDSAGQVNGSAGCNSYSASYSVNGSTLLIGTPQATGQICVDPPFIMDQESAFLRAMATSSGFSGDASGISINTELGTIQLRPVGP